MIIFPSSQKASNCIGWQAHTEWYAVMNGVFTRVVFYVKCVFALILHIICPITLTSAINLPQTYFRQKHKGLTIFVLVWTV